MSSALGSRSLFPRLSARSYLAHCAISPLSSAVVAALAAHAQSYATAGVAALPPWIEQRTALRARLAALLGAAPADIGFVPSTSAGVLAIAFGIPWRAGDRIVTFDGEFPTNVTPWRQAAATFGLEAVHLPLSGFGDGSGLGLARVEEELRRGARLVAVSAVQFQTGLAMPVAALGALCHAHGAELFVDGIQAFGCVPLSVEGVDYLACGGHKWLMGPEGAGVLYVAPQAAARLVPRLAGWLSHEDPVGFLGGAEPARLDRPLRRAADVFEIGVTSGAVYAGLGASLQPLEALGVPSIFAHVQRWHDAIEPALVARGFRSERAADPAARSGILALRAPGGADVQALVRRAAAAGVVVTAPEGHLRIAPHWPNALDEVAVALDALSAA